MDPLFIRGAAFPPMAGERPLILGLRLAPLSLGHQFLLLSIESPLVAGTGPVALRDFFTAIFLCAQPWRRATRALGAWWVPLFFRVWRWKNRRADLVAELERFRQWFREQTSNADFRQVVASAGDGPGRRTRECSAPAPYVRLLFLTTTLRLDREAALDLPVATASALYAAWLDWRGEAELTSDEDRDFWAAAAAEDAKRFNPDGSRKETGNSERETRNGEPGTENKEVGKTA